jgi:hypothetical protein
VFACHALRGRGGEHPCFSWPTAHSPEVLLISYAPPKNPTKRWPTEAQMEGWFPHHCGEHTRQQIAMRWDCTRTESSDRATRNGSAAARAEPREQRLNSRPPSQNGSRRPDQRICGNWGSMSCAPTLWKEILCLSTSLRPVTGCDMVGAHFGVPRRITKCDSRVRS